jgi:AcrR family transcriptional regulator
MTNPKDSSDTNDIRQRLLDAGRLCFLAEDYRNVSMRKVARLAGANMSMIYYYFESKEVFFEEFLSSWLQPMIDNMQAPETKIDSNSFQDFFQMYYRSALVNPEFPDIGIV